MARSGPLATMRERPGSVFKFPGERFAKLRTRDRNWMVLGVRINPNLKHLARVSSAIRTPRLLQIWGSVTARIGMSGEFDHGLLIGIQPALRP